MVNSCYKVELYVIKCLYNYFVFHYKFAIFLMYSNEKLGTPLSCAAYHGHDHIVRFLLGRDVSCNGSYTDLKVPMQCFCMYMQESHCSPLFEVITIKCYLHKVISDIILILEHWYYVRLINFIYYFIAGFSSVTGHSTRSH